MKKTYIATFVLSFMLCVMLVIFYNEYIFPLIFMPLIATNLFLPFVILEHKHITAKWQLAFFFLVPYASLLWIFADGVPATISYFREKLKTLE